MQYKVEYNGFIRPIQSAGLIHQTQVISKDGSYQAQVNDSGHFVNLPLIFTGVKTCKIWPRFSTSFAFESPQLRKESGI